MSGTIDILPDSRLKTVVTPKGAVWRNGSWWEPVFCANCGADGGLVPQENMTFMFYLCDPCFETHGAIAGTYALPDEVFFQMVAEAQLEKHGRFLTEPELVAAIDDPFDPLSRLARDRVSILKSLRR